MRLLGPAAGILARAIASLAMLLHAAASIADSALFAAANGQPKPCGDVTTPALTNDDFGVSSRVSTLYRVEPTTGEAVEVGQIQDPNLTGREVEGWLEQEAPDLPFNIDSRTWEARAPVVLDPDERLVDVCGLATTDEGTLIATATLEKTRIHVLVGIDPNTAAATLVGPLNVDKGTFGTGWLLIAPDPTLCLVSDLTAGNGALLGIASCLFYERGEGVREAPLIPRALLTQIDPATGTTTEYAHLRDEDPQSPAVNAVPLMPLSLARRPSTGKLSGTLVSVYLHYTEGGMLDVAAQHAAGALSIEPDELPKNVSASEAYWPLGRYTGPLLAGLSTALAYDGEDPSEPLYRSYLDAGTSGESWLETIDPSTGASTSVPRKIAIEGSGAPVLGVQAITFVPVASD